MNTIRPRRAFVVLSAFVLLAGLVATGATQASASSHLGPFGFITKGLGRISAPSYGEPSLTIARDGKHEAICSLGSGSNGKGTVQIWYSKNDGKSWTHTYNTSPAGGGDCNIKFLPNGTLLTADLEVTDSYIQKSTDWGAHWKALGPAGTEQDRQWFASSPSGKTVYLQYHDFVFEGEFYTPSTDGGNTWSTSPADQHLEDSPDQVTAPAIIGNGGHASIVDQGVNTFSGPLLVDRNGRDLYAVYSISDAESNVNPLIGVPPYGPVRQLVVAHSPDGGVTWSSHVADQAVPNPDGSQESTEGTLFPWGFLDSTGTVYIVFDSTRGASGDHFHQYYVYSKDKGQTWSQPVRVDGLQLSQGAAVYATGDAVRPGVIDIAWYQSNNGTPSQDKSIWTPYFAQVTKANTTHPKIRRQAVTSIPNHHGGICLFGLLCGVAPGSSDRSLLDFFQLWVNPRTKMAEIAYADNYRLADNHNFGEVVFAKQTKTP